MLTTWWVWVIKLGNHPDGSPWFLYISRMQETWASNLLITEDLWVSPAVVIALLHGQHQKKKKFLIGPWGANPSRSTSKEKKNFLIGPWGANTASRSTSKGKKKILIGSWGANTASGLKVGDLWSICMCTQHKGLWRRYVSEDICPSSRYVELKKKFFRAFSKLPRRCLYRPLEVLCKLEKMIPTHFYSWWYMESLFLIHSLFLIYFNSLCIILIINISQKFSFWLCVTVTLQRRHIRGAYNKFPDFFCMGTFIDSTHMKL